MKHKFLQNTLKNHIKITRPTRQGLKGEPYKNESNLRFEPYKNELNLFLFRFGPLNIFLTNPTLIDPHQAILVKKKKKKSIPTSFRDTPRDLSIF